MNITPEDYKAGIHKNSGVIVDEHKDILTIPFWTEDFCSKIVQFSKEHDELFSSRKSRWDHIAMEYATDDLYLSDIGDGLMEAYAEQVKKHVVPALKLANVIAECFGVYTPFVVRYMVGGTKSLGLHFDQSMFSMSIKLNDDYTGCDLVFPKQKFDNKKVPVGYALVWPSLITHPHYANELISGEKYAMTCWTIPPDRNDLPAIDFKDTK
jgi:hypothetical protein